MSANSDGIPAGLTLDEVLVVIDSIVNLLAPSFVFGHYDIEDVKQHGRMEAWRVLPKFNPDIGNPSTARDNPADRLYNFLRKHIRNRYLNLWRDKNERTDKELKPELNQRKKSLANPLPLIKDHNEIFTYEDNYQTDMDIDYFRGLINEHLSQEYITDYRRLIHGITIPKNRRLRVQAAVLEILASGGIDGETIKNW